MLSAQRQKIIDTYGVTEVYIFTILELVKQRLGILSTVKDLSVEARILSIILSLSYERNIKIDMDNMIQTMLIVDITTWQYSNQGKPDAMPIDLRYRLNNVFVRGEQINDV